MSAYREERMLRLLEHPVFGVGVRHLVLLDDDVLLEDLHGVDAAGALLARQHHLAERALAEHLHELELFQRLERSNTTFYKEIYLIYLTDKRHTPTLCL